MQFVLQNSYKLPTNYFKYKIIKAAKIVIANYKLRSADIKLDKFLQDKYDVTLKQACWFLIRNLQLIHDNSSTIVGIFKDRKLDRLASIITYGNGTFLGSRILKDALS